MFNKYCSEMEKLNSFNKEDILNKKFELFSDTKMKIYYAPHNETINKNARIFIVGITPGWTQTSLAYKTANEGLIKKLDHEEIKKACKRNSRFAGSMRKNLISMLDELNSMIPYPVFINGKNYTGARPKILDSEVLMSYIKKYFYKEVKELPNTFIIPLGKSVEEVLELMISEKIIKKEQCLLGFPHPSGANGHRKIQFEENKSNLINIIDNYFK